MDQTPAGVCLLEFDTGLVWGPPHLRCGFSCLCWRFEHESLIRIAADKVTGELHDATNAVISFFLFAICDHLPKGSCLKVCRNYLIRKVFGGGSGILHFWEDPSTSSNPSDCWRNHGWHRWGGGHLLCLGLCGVCRDNLGCGRRRPLPGHPEP